MKKNNKKDMFGFYNAINWNAVDKALADPEKRKVLENIFSAKDEATFSHRIEIKTYKASDRDCPPDYASRPMVRTVSKH